MLERLPPEVLDRTLRLVVEDVHDARRYAGVSTTLRNSVRRILSSEIAARTDAQFIQELFELGGNEANFFMVDEVVSIMNESFPGTPFYYEGGIVYPMYIKKVAHDLIKFRFRVSDFSEFAKSDLLLPILEKGPHPKLKFCLEAFEEIDFWPVNSGDDFYCAIPVAQLSFLPNDESNASSEDCYELTVRGHCEDFYWDSDLIETPQFDALEARHKNRMCTQGTAFFDFWVDESLRARLNAAIDTFASLQHPDYHPHSRGIVRDLVHPAIFSYIAGVSPLNEGITLPKGSGTDFWKRTFEGSKYQWLPSNFRVDKNGKVEILDYINNLSPRSEHEELYSCLAEVFQTAVPLVDIVYNYCVAVKPQLMDDASSDKLLEYDYYGERQCPVVPVSRTSTIYGRELQVITKIVDYELPPGEAYEGVWHVEGMSHERIVATVLYISSRSDSLEGGSIAFKRAMHMAEGAFTFCNVDQMRHRRFDEIFNASMVPMGEIKTPEGRMIVFPNSHVHKVKKLINTSMTTLARRRIVVFFIVDPSERIPSTREVPPQQQTMTMEQAKAHRLKLMEERKFNKQDWNVREIELCEH